jgi:hypothetical protein
LRLLKFILLLRHMLLLLSHRCFDYLKAKHLYFRSKKIVRNTWQVKIFFLRIFYVWEKKNQKIKTSVESLNKKNFNLSFIFSHHLFSLMLPRFKNSWKFYWSISVDMISSFHSIFFQKWSNNLKQQHQILLFYFFSNSFLISKMWKRTRIRQIFKM